MPIYKKVFNPYAKYKKKPPSSLSQPTIMPSDIGRYHPPQFFHSQGVSAGSLENNVLGHVGGGTISYGSSPQPFEISMSELVRRDLAEKHAAKPKKLDATPKTLAAMRPPTPEKLAATTPKKLAAKTPKKLAAMKPPAKKPTVAAKKPTVTAKKPTAASAAKKPTKRKSTTSTTKRKSSANPKTAPKKTPPASHPDDDTEFDLGRLCSKSRIDSLDDEENEFVAGATVQTHEYLLARSKT